jgi:hypothetical protein
LQIKSNILVYDALVLNKPCGHIKVKCKLKWCKKIPLTDPKVQRESRDTAVLILDLGARRGWVVNNTLQPLYPRGRPGTHCTGGWVGPRPVWTCVKKFLPSAKYLTSIR